MVLRLEGLLRGAWRGAERQGMEVAGHAEAGLSLSLLQGHLACLHSELAETLLTQEVSAAQKLNSVLSTFRCQHLSLGSLL